MRTDPEKYFIEVHTDKDIGNFEFAGSLLNAWLHHHDAKLRPEYFGLGEPIRKSFKEHSVADAVTQWNEAQIPLMLRRGSAPAFTVNIKWRPNKGQDTRPYPWGSSIWLALKAGDDRASELFRFLIEWFDPAFGMLTTWSDLKNKHLTRQETRLGIEEKFVGLDVNRTVPGVYWQTYFGKELLRHFPRIGATKIDAAKAETYRDGLLLCLFQSSGAIGSESGREIERSVEAEIGSDIFFRKPT